MSVVVPGAWTVNVQMPTGEVVQVNVFQLGMMANAVRFRADFGMWPPSVNKLHLTKQSICERFYIDPQYAKTYKMLADTLEEIHADFMAQIWEATNGDD